MHTQIARPLHRPPPSPPFRASLAELAALGYTPDPELDRRLAVLEAGGCLYPNVVSDAEIDSEILREAHRALYLTAADAARVEEASEGALTVERQQRIGLRSAPDRVARLFAAGAVRVRFGDLRVARPAPFYYDEEGDLAFNAPRYGLLLPVVRGGFWRALLHYQSAKDDAPRWVTSSRLSNGSKVVPSIHVTDADGGALVDRAALVTHALEAETLGESGVVCCVGLNGVGPAALAAQLRDSLPALRGVVVYAAATFAHLRALRLAGLEVREA